MGCRDSPTLCDVCQKRIIEGEPTFYNNADLSESEDLVHLACFWFYAKVSFASGSPHPISQRIKLGFQGLTR